MSVFHDTEVPGGVSLVFGDDSSLRYRFAPTGRSLSGILDGIVSAEPRYQWKEDRGVINVFPINDYPLLDSPIEQFEAKDLTTEQMMWALKSHPEFQAALAKNGLTAPHNTTGVYVGGLSSSVPVPKRSVFLEHTTVREVLNEIVRRNGRSTWSYHEYVDRDNKENERFYDLYFLVYSGL